MPREEAMSREDELSMKEAMLLKEATLLQEGALVKEFHCLATSLGSNKKIYTIQGSVCFSLVPRHEIFFIRTRIFSVHSESVPA